MSERSRGCGVVWMVMGLLLTAPAVLAQPSTSKPPPAHYRQSVADSDVASIFHSQDNPKKTKRAGDRATATEEPDTNALRMRQRVPTILSVSALRRTVATELGDWFVCVKAVRGPETFYYGLSFIGSEIVEWRPAVAIDRCEREAYGPLPPPSKKAKADDDDSDDSAPGPSKGR